jgi:protein-disulfide isomerase-like protein with CxxC motif
VALEKFLADGHVFDGHEPTAGFVLRDGVHEHRRISITQAIQRLRYVDEHGVSVYQKGYGVLHNRESTLEGAQ